ncbi:MAG: insulinase family protein [Novosphingobium sp.]|nr:insulinase family protein [Novosphingobium sp.]
MRPAAAALALLCALAAACAPQAQRLNSTAASAAKPVWAFEASDLPVEPEYRFGRLANGMRYVVRHNAYPKGTVLVRMDVAAGSLDEAENERGLAHFVEHMAFNGSTNVPEGEMVRLLERDGLAFGADTNASTGFQATTYKLDLPGNRAGLIDTALMLMRETASELTFSPAAVERERGVVLSEMRDRNNYALRNAREQAAFLHPHALYPRRFPIGVAETVAAATPEALKAFWQREYVPAATTVIVVGDIDAGEVEAMIARRFGDWQGPPAEAQPDAGPVDIRRADKADAHIDQALSERVVASRHGRWLNEPDTAANRRENVLRQIGYAIVNRRLERISRLPDPPFRDAGFGTGMVFRTGRTTNLVVDTVDGKWRPGLIAGATELRRALKHGFTEVEVAEQVAILRRAAINAAASADTRSNTAHVNAIMALLRDDRVPTPPQGALARLEALIPEITSKSVLDALKREAIALDKPLIRFQGRRLPTGGADALRQAWQEIQKQSPAKAPANTATAFAYSAFGEPGSVIADEREPMLGIRRLRFANGVRLNLKRTDLQKDVVLAQVTLDGGNRLATKGNPLAVQMIPMFVAGGLGKHSQDELQSILAGHTVGTGLSSRADAFVASARTTPDDLELQMRVFAAFVTDPGYRSEGELRYRLDINNYFLRKNATPGSALGAEIGGILSDGDLRFSLQSVEDYRKLTFAKLKGDLADRLAKGAIEIGMVGDFDEDAAIAAVARTFGALPAREADFRPMTDQPPRPFTDRRTRRVVRHDGPADQALIQFVWPTRDDSNAMDASALHLLERIVRIELIETLRERLGKAYSPGAASSPSRYWQGYGTFSLSASVDVRDLAATRAAILETIRALRAAPVSDDVLQRARQPLLESHDNALKTNSGWLLLVDRAQSESDRIGRYLTGKERLMAITPEYIALLASRYLDPAQAVEIDVLPRDFTEPAQ